MRRLLARLRAVVGRPAKPAPRPDDDRYGLKEHLRWQPPDVPSRLGWMERKPVRPFRSDDDLF